MYSVYGRRFNLSKNKFNANGKFNNILGTNYNPYQPKTANTRDLSNLNNLYISMNGIHKISPVKKKQPYNRPVFNYGNLLKNSIKFKSVSKNNCPESLITNSYNIINNNPKNKYNFNKYSSNTNFINTSREKESDMLGYTMRQNNFYRNNETEILINITIVIFNKNNKHFIQIMNQNLINLQQHRINHL